MTSTTTRRRGFTRRTLEERAAQRQALLDRLDAFRAELDDLDDDDRLMEVIAHFEEHYSERNAQLIVMQNPEATEVRGFHAWHDLGRSVRRGEHGIQILAPAGRTDSEEPSEAHPEGTKGRQFYKIVYVFDYAQTEPITMSARGGRAA